MAAADFSSVPLEHLAATISNAASVVTKFLHDEGHAQPSFASDGPLIFPHAPENITAARNELIAAARQIQFLAFWPVEAMQWNLSMLFHDSSSLRWLYHFNIASAVPLTGTVSLAEIAATAGVDDLRLSRVLRHAMTNHLFCEPEPGMIAHTAMSSLLVRVKQMRDCVGYLNEETFPASAKLVEATEKFGGRAAVTQSAFNVAFATELPSFEWIAMDELRADRFSETMKSLMESKGYSAQHLVDGYDWERLGKAVVVDVGGSSGQVSMAIADKAPDLRFVVQDLPQVIKKARAEIPITLKDRISFMAHDFFTPNPVEGADVFLLRQILHDWPDSDAIRILKNIVSSMTTKTKLIICDVAIPPPGTLHYLEERSVRTMDMQMMTMFNSHERALEEWKSLFKDADPVLRMTKVTKPVGSNMSIMEVMLVSDNNELGDT